MRQIVADEEQHGIYRKQWGGLNVSDLQSKEADLLKKQQEGNAKLDKLRDAYDDAKREWNGARTKLDSWLGGVVASGGVVRTKGVALAG